MLSGLNIIGIKLLKRFISNSIVLLIFDSYVTNGNHFANYLMFKRVFWFEHQVSSRRRRVYSVPTNKKYFSNVTLFIMLTAIKIYYLYVLCVHLKNLYSFLVRAIPCKVGHHWWLLLLETSSINLSFFSKKVQRKQTVEFFYIYTHTHIHIYFLNGLQKKFFYSKKCMNFITIPNVNYFIKVLFVLLLFLLFYFLH